MLSGTYFRLADAPWPAQAASAANLPTGGTYAQSRPYQYATIFWAWPNAL